MQVPNMLGTQQSDRAVLGAFQQSGTPPRPRGPALPHRIAVLASSTSAQRQAGHDMQACDASHLLFYRSRRTAVHSTNTHDSACRRCHEPIAAPGATCCSLLLLLQPLFSAALQAPPLLFRASQQEDCLVNLLNHIL